MDTGSWSSWGMRSSWVLRDGVAVDAASSRARLLARTRLLDASARLLDASVGHEDRPETEEHIASSSSVTPSGLLSIYACASARRPLRRGDGPAEGRMECDEDGGSCKCGGVDALLASSPGILSAASPFSFFPPLTRSFSGSFPLRRRSFERAPFAPLSSGTLPAPSGLLPASGGALNPASPSAAHPRTPCPAPAPATRPR